MATERTTPLVLPYTDLDLVHEFVGQAEAAPSTLRNYHAHLAEYAAFLARHGATLRGATPGDVQRFMAYLRTPDRAGVSQIARSDALSPSTRKQFLAALRGFYRYALIVGLVATDPTIAIRSPRITTEPGIHLSADEIRRLLDAPGTPRDRIQTYLLAYTAARAGELRDLKWSDIDFPNAVVQYGARDPRRASSISTRRSWSSCADGGSTRR